MSWQIALTVVSTAFQVYQKQQQRKTEANWAYYNANLERQRAEENLKLNKIQATQEELARRRNLADVQATQRARAGYPTDSSPSFLAIRADDETRAEEDIDNMWLMASARGSEFRMQSQAAVATMNSAKRRSSSTSHENQVNKRSKTFAHVIAHTVVLLHFLLMNELQLTRCACDRASIFHLKSKKRTICV